MRKLGTSALQRIRKQFTKRKRRNRSNHLERRTPLEKLETREAPGSMMLVPAGATFNPATRQFAWTPAELQGPGLYEVDFTVTDDGSPALSDTKTVLIEVNEVNVAPILDPIGDRTIDELTNVSFTVTASDSD